MTQIAFSRTQKDQPDTLYHQTQGPYEFWYQPAIQSTAMPSTRLMPVVMMSSLQVWSRLARDILFKPMSVQYMVSFPMMEKIKVQTRENVMMNVAAAKLIYAFKQRSLWNHYRARQHGPFHQAFCGTIKHDGGNTRKVQTQPIVDMQCLKGDCWQNFTRQKTASCKICCWWNRYGHSLILQPNHRNM